MTPIHVFFQPQMQKANKSFSPSSSKPEMVVKDWLNHYPEKIKIESFAPLRKEDLYRVHDIVYVDNIFNGTEKNGFGLKDGNFASTFLHTSGSLYAACVAAINYKKEGKKAIAVSPTSGFHHARFEKAEGFCTFNGLIVASMLLKKNHEAHKIGILDFDMHYGNGTDELIHKHNLSYITHYSAGLHYDLYYPHLNFLKPVITFFYNRFFNQQKGEKKPHFRQKKLAGKGSAFLLELDHILAGFKDCEIIIYQAGADQHINDPYGGLLTYEQMRQRDRQVFDFALRHNIPLIWNLAGGYQKDSQGTIEPVLLCHRNTMQACLDTFSDIA